MITDLLPTSFMVASSDPYFENKLWYGYLSRHFLSQGKPTGAKIGYGELHFDLPLHYFAHD